MAFDAAHAPIAAPTADPAGPHVSSSCFELLLIELVPLAYRLASEQASRDAAADANGWGSSPEKPGSGSGKKTSGHAASASVGAATTAGVKGTGSAVTGTTGLGVGGIGGAVEGMDEEETREAVFWRLDALGYRVGLGLVDR